MPQLTREWIDAQRKRAEETKVVVTKNGVIVVAHPGQNVNPDPTERKHEFGILPSDKIERLIDTAHAPPLEKLERQLEEQEAEVVRAAAPRRRPPAAPPAKKAEPGPGNADPDAPKD
jgi:hypothetical protein